MVTIAWLAGALAAAMMASSALAAPACDDAPIGALAVTTPTVPSGVTIRYLGVSSLLIDDGRTQILFDGFFSRPPLWRALVGFLQPEATRLCEGLKRAGVGPDLKAVFVAHAHHDHALDAPWIAREYDADIIGSEDVGQLALGQNVTASQVKPAGTTPSFSYGAFQVTPIKAPHSRPKLFSGHINAPVTVPAWAPRWRMGRANYSYLVAHGQQRILIHPSAAFEPNAYEDVRADIVFLGMAGIGRKRARFAENYWDAVVRTTQARFVAPIHWDNFGRDLSEGLKPMPWPIDRIGRGRRRLEALAGDCVSLVDLAAYETTSLEQLRRRHPDRAGPLPRACRANSEPLRPASSRPAVENEGNG